MSGRERCSCLYVSALMHMYIPNIHVVIFQNHNAFYLSPCSVSESKSYRSTKNTQNSNACLSVCLSVCAAQFSTTVKKLLSVNPHLTHETAPDMQLLGATRLCVIACTSHPSPTYSYKWAY